MQRRIAAHQLRVEKAEIGAIPASGNALRHARHVHADAVGRTGFTCLRTIKTVLNAFLQMLPHLRAGLALRLKRHRQSPEVDTSFELLFLPALAKQAVDRRNAKQWHCMSAA